MGVALEMTRAALRLADRHDLEIIARKIIELAKAGERNPDLLCERALRSSPTATAGVNGVASVERANDQKMSPP
jgi:hypothetical protein